MSTSSNLMDVLVSHWLKDAEIRAFIDANFSPSTLLTVYKGIDKENLPPQEHYPLIAISAIERHDKGDSKDTINLICSFAVGILAEAVQITFHKADGSEVPESDSLKVSRKVNYKGLELTENFRSVVEDSIFKIRGIGARIDVDGETLLENFHPLFLSSGSIGFELKKNYRSPRV